MGASQADAEDCAQEALTAGWSRVVAGDRSGARLAWLIAEARERYVDTVYRRAREPSMGLVPDGVPDHAAEGPEDPVVRRVEAGYLMTQLYRLPPVTQTVCLLIGRGMDRKVVARQLRLSMRSVESHLTRARRYLRTRGTLGVVAIAGA
ncbi:MAG TPA: sigma-70 family RNA polymerase sigma factor, partial [Actinophytocola sp.]|uniref:RNA polymerase sigma factor n=1 Tax=Actinophytocola sp. TaxID=1872138 RepID=UPI002DDDA8FA